ncbi:MAG: DUF1990 family protein [Pyrinomonadaceae bacterium]
MTDELIRGAAGRPFSYSAVGGSRGLRAPAGFVVDHNRTRLGCGCEVFERSRQAVKEWKMFDLGWVEVADPQTPIEVGRNVAVLARLLGIYSLNLCRIVYVVDEQAGGVERFGFAYGTLDEHAESGEERFTVEFHRDTGDVWYDLFAFSRPAHPLVRLGYPYARALQRSFVRDSLAAMRRAVSGVS